jgi:hypothetical protein
MTELSVRCGWEFVGPVTRTVRGDLAQLHLPDALTSRAGVYRLLLDGPSIREVYVGESDNTRRRGRQYRRGDGSQTTSRWVHQHLHDRLSTGMTIVMEMATAAQHRLGEGPWLDSDLSLREHRLIVENAAIVEAVAAGERVVLNRVVSRRARSGRPPPVVEDDVPAEG